MNTRTFWSRLEFLCFQNTTGITMLSLKSKRQLLRFLKYRKELTVTDVRTLIKELNTSLLKSGFEEKLIKNIK